MSFDICLLISMFVDHDHLKHNRHCLTSVEINTRLKVTVIKHSLNICGHISTNLTRKFKSKICVLRSNNQINLM